MTKINKYANIYDKDGNLIRKVNDKGVLDKYTLEEVENLVDELTKKYKEDPDNQELKTKLNNVNSWLFNMYNHMSRKELADRMSMVSDAVENAKTNATNAEKEYLDTVNTEIDKLKSAIEGTTVDTKVEQPMEVTPPVMDEYVEFEELPAEDGRTA